MFRTMALCFVVLLAIVSPARGQDAIGSQTKVSAPLGTDPAGIRSSDLGVNVGQNARSSQARVLALLEASGEAYTKVQDSLWEVAYRGKNAKSIQVRVMVVDDDLAVVFSKLADRTDFLESAELLTRFLKFNNDIDSVKIALLKEQFILRLDMHVRLLDDHEWSYALGQVAAAFDEAAGLFTKDLRNTTPAPAK